MIDTVEQAPTAVGTTRLYRVRVRVRVGEEVLDALDADAVGVRVRVNVAEDVFVFVLLGVDVGDFVLVRVAVTAGVRDAVFVFVIAGVGVDTGVLEWVAPRVLLRVNDTEAVLERVLAAVLLLDGVGLSVPVPLLETDADEEGVPVSDELGVTELEEVCV